MHGLVFVTWEKYLSERFGSGFLAKYRELVQEKRPEILLANRLYDDEILLAAVGATSQLSQLSVDTLLEEYGRYFIINGLTRHLCAYILSNIHTSTDLLLAMRDTHDRLHQTHAAIRPPLFEYQLTTTPNEIIIIYDSPRKLCSLLKGAIKGAAERYGETVQIQEQKCMAHGDSICQIKAVFSPSGSKKEHYTTPEQAAKQDQLQQLMQNIWTVLPEAGSSDGLTLTQIQDLLIRHKRIQTHQLRPALLLRALQQLQFAGYATSTTYEGTDDLMNRHYWRIGSQQARDTKHI